MGRAERLCLLSVPYSVQFIQNTGMHYAVEKFVNGVTVYYFSFFTPFYIFSSITFHSG